MIRPGPAGGVNEGSRPESRYPRRRRPLRKIILRNTAALPALVTLLNGMAGFASIHFATKSELGKAQIGQLNLAAWMIFAAMVFDALDGRLARISRQATDFGAQLDSLCDAISFGVAPAVLMVQTVFMALQIEHFDFSAAHSPLIGRIVIVIAAVYMCCTVLRLARFNIENAPDVLHHMEFKGLPSPGAAAVVAAVVLLFDHLQGFDVGWRSAAWLNRSVAAALPTLSLTVALLMVSRLHYPHVINRFVVGRRPFGYIVVAIVAIIAAAAFRKWTLAAGTIVFAASGPALALWRRFHPQETQAGETGAEDTEAGGNQ